VVLPLLWLLEVDEDGDFLWFSLSLSRSFSLSFLSLFFFFDFFLDDLFFGVFISRSFGLNGCNDCKLKVGCSVDIAVWMAVLCRD